MDGYQVRFSSELRSRLEKIISSMSDILSTVPVPDYPTYMERVGHIKGLRSVLQEMSDVETAISTPDKPVTPRLKLKGYEI